MPSAHSWSGSPRRGGLTVNTEGARCFGAAHAVLSHTGVGPLVGGSHAADPKAVVTPDLIPAPLPTPRLGWPQLQTPSLSPRMDTRIGTHKNKAGLNSNRSWYPPTRERRWRLGRVWISLCCQVRGCLPSSFRGQGMLLSWLGLLTGRRKGILTCRWAVPHPPCAIVDGVGDLPAPHMGNPRGHLPGPPG